MSIADKLTLLINTKQDIKSAISEKGVEVTGGMTTYADAIRRIETGGGGGGDSFYVPIGLKFAYKRSDNYYYAPEFTLPNLILADDYDDASHMFDGNKSLTSINGIHSSNSLLSCSYMFAGCNSLQTIPQFITTWVMDMSFMFKDCFKLKSIPLLDATHLEIITNIFNKPDSSNNQPYPELTDLGGFKNLKLGFNLSGAPNLTYQSLMNVINNLYDFVGNGSTHNEELYIGRSNSYKLDWEDIAIATNKGWTIME